jgi:hypothetical protein
MDAPRTGGTADFPARLYEPGTGSCPTCGQLGVPTYANGQLGAHGAVRLWGEQKAEDGTPLARTRITTCTGWGLPAGSWDLRRI